MKKLPKFIRVMIWTVATPLALFIVWVGLIYAAPMIPMKVMAYGAKVAGDAFYPSGTWRYKMTVNVETPEGIKTGSAVREVYVKSGPSLGADRRPAVTLKGEAVVVDLGARGVVLALLKGYKVGADYGADIPAITYSPKGAVMSDEAIKYMDTLKAGPTVIDPTWYPQFVRFRDINDPKTVENLLEMESDEKYPSTFTIKKDHFAEAFGAGVKLRSITIEMTDEPVTWGVEKWLPWLAEYYSKMFDGQRYNTIKSEYPFANSLSSGAFSTGDKK